MSLDSNSTHDVALENAAGTVCNPNYCKDR